MLIFRRRKIRLQPFPLALFCRWRWQWPSRFRHESNITCIISGIWLICWRTCFSTLDLHYNTLIIHIKLVTWCWRLMRTYGYCDFFPSFTISKWLARMFLWFKQWWEHFTLTIKIACYYNDLELCITSYWLS